MAGFGEGMPNHVFNPTSLPPPLRVGGSHMELKLENAKKLLSYDLDGADPRGVLTDVLRASVELLSIEENDFAWSSWQDSATAVAEVSRLLAVVEAGGTPERLALSVIFAPTGPMQEVSISSGWGEAFLKLAECYDYAEKGLWKHG